MSEYSAKRPKEPKCPPLDYMTDTQKECMETFIKHEERRCLSGGVSPDAAVLLFQHYFGVPRKNAQLEKYVRDRIQHYRDLDAWEMDRLTWNFFEGWQFDQTIEAA